MPVFSKNSLFLAPEQGILRPDGFDNGCFLSQISVFADFAFSPASTRAAADAVSASMSKGSRRVATTSPSYRVMGWPFDASSSARTAYIGKLINRLIYEPLPPGVLEDLRRKNPVDPLTKRRKRKHFQYLTEDIGDPHIDKQITAVTTLLRATPDGQWKFFDILFKHAFPPAQPDLFMADEIARLRLAPPDKEEAAN